MATIAVGDIHGNARALESLLENLLPDLKPTDTLVFLGDYIDRGADVKSCIDRIVALNSDAGFSVVTLMGNHEEWMLATMHDYTRHSWLVGAEAFDTIISYSPEAAVQLRHEAAKAGSSLILEDIELPYHLFFDAMPSSHKEFFEQLKTFHRSEEVVCVHAGVDLDGVPLEETGPRTFTWGPDGFPDQYQGTDDVVYGHKNFGENDRGWPKPHILLNRTFGIDTISSGVLTALRFPDTKVYQSQRFAAAD
jgi:serine/threonine protein phosphatase 1